jgi:hypothetical protein
MYSTLCIVSADTSQVLKTMRRGPSGAKYYVQEFSIVVLLGLTELKAQISWVENVCLPLICVQTRLTYCFFL